MAKEIYTKLTVLYLAELERLESKVNNCFNLAMTSNYDSGVMLDLATAKAKLDYFKEFFNDVLDYVKVFDDRE